MLLLRRCAGANSGAGRGVRRSLKRALVETDRVLPPPWTSSTLQQQVRHKQWSVEHERELGLYWMLPLL